LPQGPCWLELDGERTTLETGDIVAFPFGTPHMLGAGNGERLLDPGGDLPSKPWNAGPILRYDDGAPQVRLLCGYIQCEAMDFAPFRQVLPRFIHVRTNGLGATDWLVAATAQIIVEVDRPERGGSSILERLTEVAFLEVLRREFLRRENATSGWLAAIRNPGIGRCLGLLHDHPARDWTLEELARASGLSRSALCGHFTAMLGTSPIRYLRDWRLYLASVQLRLMDRTLSAIALDAGYGSEAAFNRAFARRFGKPPAEWRRSGSAR